LILKFWGTRGSIPSPGPDTIKYGGNTTCIELRLDDGTLIIFDAGTGIRNLGTELIRSRKNKIINLFISHSHWDHIQGFPFFKPAYQDDTIINIFGCPPTYDKLREILTNQMESQYFPVNFTELKAKIIFKEINNGHYKIGNGILSFIQNNHPGTAYGVKVTESGCKMVFITDNELIPSEKEPDQWKKFVDFCQDADLLIHDAQYLNSELINNSGFGHSSFEETLNLGLQAHVKHLIFFHHNPSRTDSELDYILNNVQERLMDLESNIEISAATEGLAISLCQNS